MTKKPTPYELLAAAVFEQAHRDIRVKQKNPNDKPDAERFLSEGRSNPNYALCEDILRTGVELRTHRDMPGTMGRDACFSKSPETIDTRKRKRTQ
jgi:hypothetical protein